MSEATTCHARSQNGHAPPVRSQASDRAGLSGPPWDSSLTGRVGVLVQVGGCALAATAQPPPPLEWRLIDGSRRRRYVIVLCIGGLPTGSASRGGLDLSCRSITYSRPEMLAPQPLVRMS
jgi:hypothetical protein